MLITAKFAGRCSTCSSGFAAGARVEWSKGSPARHAACAAGAASSAPAPAPRSRNWDSSAFRGYGAGRGAYRKACKSDGNCSSFGSGRSCGGHDCDGM